MSIENLKFSESEFSGKDISSLPDRPSDAGITAEELKKRFDQIGKFMIALGRFNELIDALISTAKGTSGAENIKSAPIDGLTGSTIYEMLVELSEKASDIPVPTKISDLENDANFVNKDYVDQLAFNAGSVSSVNGKGGAVELNAEDVNAIPAENFAVKTGYIANYGVTTEKLADRSVTADKIAAGAVTPAAIGAAPATIFGKDELVEGSASPYVEGTLYFVVEDV